MEQSILGGGGGGVQGCSKGKKLANGKGSFVLLVLLLTLEIGVPSTVNPTWRPMGLTNDL